MTPGAAPRARARSEEQKLARRKAIVAAAGRLFEKKAFEDIRMTQVARAAGLAKGTVFLYFKTKEELFLALAREEMEAWHARINESLQSAASSGALCAAAPMAEMLAASVESSPRLLRLTAILGTVLERNVEREAALDFKLFMKRRMLFTASLFERCLPGFKPGDGARLYLYVVAMIVGIYPMAEPSPVVRSVLKEPGLGVFRIDFRRASEQIIGMLIRGWE